MKGRIAALILFGFLGLLASSAWGQACLPVVYAFRHAEDTNPPGPHPPNPLFALTPTGQAHADLYPTMVGDFEATNFEATDTKPCPVTKVYATTKKDKEGPCDGACKSATNAFDTAKPLAAARMGADPITTVANGSLQLYEFVGNGNKVPGDPNYSNPTATALRTELLATANLQQSSAIFWTSQGLHVLGGAIIKANSRVPIKPEENGGALPPRNAVYIFTALGSAPNITGFDDTRVSTQSRDDTPFSRPSSSVYVQCFNWVGATSQPKLDKRDNDYLIPPAGGAQHYYCGYNEQSSVGGPPGKGCAVGKRCGSSIPNERTNEIKGKICNTDHMLEDSAGPSIFGACQGLAEQRHE
jgi:hypothetical protein